ncbi:MAG: hypothetical protein WBO36_12015 [Saprospiraceae bacterium]
MQKKNLIIAIATAIIVWMGWNYFRNPSITCTWCNNSICRQNASVIFFDKEELCDKNGVNFLNPPFPSMGLPESEISNESARLQPLPISYGQPYISIDTFTNDCGQRLACTYTLAGYYIQPSPNISQNVNIKLDFYPVWLRHTPQELIEIVGAKLTLTPYAQADATSQNAANSGSIMVPIIPYNIYNYQNGFSHSIFQFHPDAVTDGFTKAYISWYELKLILENCKYLGITGAQVSTGNIMAQTWGSLNEAELGQSCNKSYFTYRFIGFNKFIPETPIEEPLLIPSNFVKVKSGPYTFNPAIPTETWATPCPPMWY